MSSSPDTSEMVAATGVTVRVFARTDVGRTREHNEDAFLVADLRSAEPLPFDDDDPSAQPHEVRTGNPGMLFIVADGLGGAAAGEVASHMAVQTVFDTLRDRVGPTAIDPARFASALRDATLAANEAIHEHAKRHRELHGMGTTITAAALLGDTLFLAQVGDSRAYIIRDGVAQQITKDQSLMQKLVEAGEITPEQAELSARRNIILQALGPETSVKIDLTHQLLRRGDLLVLCSDGLFGQVRGDEFAQVASGGADLDALCRHLIDRANERGGPDNITVVAARFDGEGLASPTLGDALGHQAFLLAGQTEERKTPTDPHIRAVPRPTSPAAPAAAPNAAEAPTGPAAPVSPLAANPASEPKAPVSNAPPAAGSARPPRTSAALDARRERARIYYIVLGALAIIIALLSLWQLLKR